MTYYLEVAKIKFPCGASYSCDVHLNQYDNKAQFTAIVDMSDATYEHRDSSLEGALNKMRVTLGKRLVRRKEQAKAVPYCLDNTDFTKLLQELQGRVCVLEGKFYKSWFGA